MRCYFIYSFYLCFLESKRQPDKPCLRGKWLLKQYARVCMVVYVSLNLWNIFKISSKYLWNIFEICWKYLWNIFELSSKYLGNIFEFLLNIFRLSLNYHWNIFELFLNFFEMSSNYLQSIFEKSSKYLCNIFEISLNYFWNIFELSLKYCMLVRVFVTSCYFRLDRACVVAFWIYQCVIVWLTAEDDRYVLSSVKVHSSSWRLVLGYNTGNERSVTSCRT